MATRKKEGADRLGRSKQGSRTWRKKEGKKSPFNNLQARIMRGGAGGDSVARELLGGHGLNMEKERWEADNTGKPMHHFYRTVAGRRKRSVSLNTSVGPVVSWVA